MGDAFSVPFILSYLLLRQKLGTENVPWRLCRHGWQKWRLIEI